MTDAPRASLADEAYQVCLEMLASDEFPPGTRLPSENDLARRLKVSRPIVRQALVRLRGEGKLVTRKGSGTVVLAQVARLNVPLGPLDSISDVASFLEFRCSLEGEIAAHAARRASRSAVNAIRQARDALDKQTAIGAPAVEEDIAFHAAIANASQNRFFVAVLQSFKEQVMFSIELSRRLSAQPLNSHLVEVRNEHSLIENAIAASNPVEAQEAMKNHLRRGISRLFGKDYEWLANRSASNA